MSDEQEQEPVEKPVTALEVRLAARRRRVAMMLSRGWSLTEIAAALEVSDETVRRDVIAIRKAFARDMGESSSVIGIAESVIRRARERERELWIMYEEARGKRDGDGKLLPGNKNDLMARLHIARELRANISHEVKVLQSLGLVYKAPEQVALQMRMLAQVQALPDAALEQLSNATNPAAFTKLLASFVDDDSIAALAAAQEPDEPVAIVDAPPPPINDQKGGPDPDGL